MTLAQPTQTGTSGVVNHEPVHLLLAKNNVQTAVEKPEQVMESIQAQATKVSTVLENILLEPRGEPHWGINE